MNAAKHSFRVIPFIRKTILSRFYWRNSDDSQFNWPSGHHSAYWVLALSSILLNNMTPRTRDSHELECLPFRWDWHGLAKKSQSALAILGADHHGQKVCRWIANFLPWVPRPMHLEETSIPYPCARLPILVYACFLRRLLEYGSFHLKLGSISDSDEAESYFPFLYVSTR